MSSSLPCRREPKHQGSLAVILFPAIDLFGGKVVRLSKGDFARKTAYGITAADVARKYRDAGCTHIHIVDLEGAETGRPCHLRQLEKIAELGMFVQYGGGLRYVAAVQQAADAGADRIMIGSLLFKNAEMPHLLAERFGAAVMPAIDVKRGEVVHSGWLATTGQKPAELIRKLSVIGFSVFLVTDTERDGLLQGIRKDFYEPLLGAGGDIVAAGGITTASDISELARIGVAGAVIGKSLYEGRVIIEAALAVSAGGM